MASYLFHHPSWKKKNYGKQTPFQTIHHINTYECCSSQRVRALSKRTAGYARSLRKTVSMPVKNLFGWFSTNVGCWCFFRCLESLKFNFEKNQSTPTWMWMPSYIFSNPDSGVFYQMIEPCIAWISINPISKFEPYVSIKIKTGLRAWPGRQWQRKKNIEEAGIHHHHYYY